MRTESFVSSMVIIAGAIMTACTGAAAGTRPDDMSVAGHDAAAVRWVSSAQPNPSVAAQHHAASQALTDAEDRACNGVAPSDRATSPFSRRRDIESVAPLYGPVGAVSEGPTSNQLIGASVSFRSVPGLTREWFQRVVDCHLAHNASFGHPVAEMQNCPLVPKNVSAVVRSSGADFIVDVSSKDSTVAQEILRRAQGSAAGAATR